MSFAKQVLGLENCREGSRAVGYCGPDNNEWENYVEVPADKLKALATMFLFVGEIAGGIWLDDPQVCQLLARERIAACKEAKA